MPKKILIIHRTADFYAGVLGAVYPDATIVPIAEEAQGGRALPAAAWDHMRDTDAIVSIGRWMNADTLATCERLQWFQCLIAGTDHVEPFVRGAGVMLTNARGIQGTQMAEMAILHMLAHMRLVPRLVRSQAAHSWDRFTPRVLSGRKVIVVGVGLIAESVARLCKAFGMTTIGVSRTPRPVDGFDAVEPRDRLLSIVAEADFVVILLPLTAENEGSIGADVFAAMKPEAGLINISRGGVVDEAALIEALQERRIAFAGLDVFQTSPLPPDSPLWDMDNVFITPQLGGRSDRYDEAAVEIVKENVGHFIKGETDRMIHVVVPKQAGGLRSPFAGDAQASQPSAIRNPRNV